MQGRRTDGTAREKMTLRAALAKVVAGGTGMSGMGLAGGVNYQTVEAYCGGGRGGEKQCSDTGLCRESTHWRDSAEPGV